MVEGVYLMMVLLLLGGPIGLVSKLCEAKELRRRRHAEEIRQRRQARRMKEPRIKDRVDYWAA